MERAHARRRAPIPATPAGPRPTDPVGRRGRLAVATSVAVPGPQREATRVVPGRAGSPAKTTLAAAGPAGSPAMTTFARAGHAVPSAKTASMPRGRRTGGKTGPPLDTALRATRPAARAGRPGATLMARAPRPGGRGPVPGVTAVRPHGRRAAAAGKDRLRATAVVTARRARPVTGAPTATGAPTGGANGQPADAPGPRRRTRRQPAVRGWRTLPGRRCRTRSAPNNSIPRRGPS